MTKLAALETKIKEAKTLYNEQGEPELLLLPYDKVEKFMEDMEALSSPTYLKSIESSRKSKKRYSSGEVKKELGLNV